MKPSRMLISLLPLALACGGDDGVAGKNSLVATSPESAGDNCTNGGLRIETGLDDDGNGELDSSEVEATDYVCSGEDGQDGDDGEDGVGAEDIMTSVTPATAAQCPGGGQQIQFENAVGAPTGEPVVICGSDLAQSFGPAPVVRTSLSELANGEAELVLSSGGGDGEGDGTVILTASISTRRRGVIVATGRASVFCASAPGAPPYGVCSPTVGNTVSLMTILQSTAPRVDGNSGEYNTIFGVPEDRETLQTATAVFSLDAGTYTFNLIGEPAETVETASSVSLSYSTADFTLVFVPASE